MKKTMKNFSCIVIILSVFACSDKKNNVTIEVNFKNANTDTLFLVSENTTDQKPIIDTLIIKEGKASIQKNQKEILQYQLVLKNTRSFKDFFVGTGTTTLTINDTFLKDVQIIGTQAQKDFEEYGIILKKITTQYDSIAKDFQTLRENPSEALYQKADAALKKLGEEKMLSDSLFINTHNNSVIAAYVLLINMVSTQSTSDKTLAVLNTLSKDVQASYYATRIKQIAKPEPKIGQLAPEFKQNTPDDKLVQLSDYRGKLVLLDFWASWCKPCRQNNPALVRLYEKYHPLGLEIIGISLDAEKELWVKAIQKDKLTWTHISDLKGWGNDIAQTYKIESIPNTVLIDAKGTIVAMGIEPQQLNKVLDSLLKK